MFEKRLFRILSLVLLTCMPCLALAQSVPQHPLVQKSDFHYLGSFRMQTGEDYFSYGATALGFYRDPAGRKSLYLDGHAWHNRLGQIEIPDVLSQDPDWNSLPEATTLQTPVDATEGHLNDTEVGYAPKIGGTFVYNNRLIITGVSTYNADGSQTVSHGACGLNLTTPGDFIGFFEMGGGGHARMKAGYMTPIPADWQALLGGPALTGQGPLSIISAASNGPAAFSFNPDDVGAVEPIPAHPLSYYTLSNPLYPGGCTVQNEYFNCTSHVGGAAFPNGTNSVLFFGTHGSGPVCYGNGGSTNTNPGEAWCYDPEDSYKGYHAYPYEHMKVWAYDAAEMAEVSSGVRQPWEIRPYAIWTFDDMLTGQIHGAAFDPVEQRLYLSTGGGETPQIDVLQLTVTGNPAPPTPTPIPSATPSPTVSPTATPTRTPTRKAKPHHAHRQPHRRSATQRFCRRHPVARACAG